MAIETFGQPSLVALIAPQPAPVRYFALMAGGVGAGAALIAWAGMPIWGAAIMVLALLAQPTAQTWHVVGARFGARFMVLSVLLYLQSFHTFEHIAQFVEFHVLNWPPRQSTGLLSGLNVEVVHFLWNWFVFLTMAWLLRAGLRSGPGNLFGWLFLGWSLLHTLEHTYLMIQYLATVRVLWSTGGSLSFAEGLPGILGRGGWLATHAELGNFAGFICTRLPVIAQIPRLDVHFFWNTTELFFMLPFAVGAARNTSAPAMQHVMGAVEEP